MPQVQRQPAAQSAVAQLVSVTDRQTTGQPGAYREETDVQDEYIKIIGLGQRGISATSRLMGEHSGMMVRCQIM